MKEIKLPKKKLPILTARQVALTATIGGLGFATRVLGLVIPMPVPGLMLDIRNICYVTLATIAGPYAGLIAVLLGGLPIPFPPAAWIGGLCSIPFVSYVWKNLGLWRVKSKFYRTLGLIVTVGIFSWLFMVPGLFIYWYVLRLWPFEMVLWWFFGGPQYLMMVFDIVGALIGIRALSVKGKPPKPTWRWH